MFYFLKNNCILLIYFAYLGNFLVHIACIYWTFLVHIFQSLSITKVQILCKMYILHLLHFF
jgi:hypothetical protein